MTSPPPSTSDRGRWRRSRRLTGDASCRRYHRLEDASGETAIAVEYPADCRREMARDLEVRRWLAEHGLRVPRLLASDLDSGWAMLEDLGSSDAEAVMEAASREGRRQLAERALQPLATLAGLDPTELPTWNLPLDRDRLRWELAGFELWYLRHRRGLSPSPDIAAWLDALASQIAGHPTRVCHRDYHLNNLFLMPSGQVAVIDYQDLLVGPDTYDAVSLLEERAMPRLLSEQDRRQWRMAWARQTEAKPGWRQRWLRVRLQRALKVLGTFSRLLAAGGSSYRQWLETSEEALRRDADRFELPDGLRSVLLD